MTGHSHEVYVCIIKQMNITPSDTWKLHPKMNQSGSTGLFLIPWLMSLGFRLIPQRRVQLSLKMNLPYMCAFSYLKCCPAAVLSQKILWWCRWKQVVHSSWSALSNFLSSSSPGDPCPHYQEWECGTEEVGWGSPQIDYCLYMLWRLMLVAGAVMHSPLDSVRCALFLHWGSDVQPRSRVHWWLVLVHPVVCHFSSNVPHHLCSYPLFTPALAYLMVC